MGVKLSVCIPIYNCAEFIGQALDSILSQAGQDVEIIVFDGGSTDGTPSVMRPYLQAWPNLRYYRAEQRGGIDADMARCAGYASGEYLWLFSGDDVMRPGAISRVHEWISKGEDVYLIEHTICGRNMNFLRTYPMLMPNQEAHVDFLNPISRKAWFSRALSTEPFFSFMSSLVVKREKWEAGKLIEEFNGSCWGHVARLFDLIPMGLRVCYVAEVWLDQRGENDSFADKGVVNRYRIAIEGYHRLADKYFGHKSEEAFYIRRVIRKEFSLSMLLHAKECCFNNPERENRDELDRLVRMEYCDLVIRGWINRFIYFYVTSPRRLHQVRRWERRVKRWENRTNQLLKRFRGAITNE